MVEIIGDKVTLREATKEDVDELYYWKYEEKEQAARQWNGPYIPEQKKPKEQYRKIWLQDNEIYPNVPDSLIIDVKGKLIGYVGSHWVDKNTNWLETGIVIYMIRIFGTVAMGPKRINYGLIFFSNLLVYIDWVCLLGPGI